MFILMLLAACTGDPATTPVHVPEPAPATEPAPAPEPAPPPAPAAVGAVTADDATAAFPSAQLQFVGSYHAGDITFGNGMAFLGLCDGERLEELRVGVAEEFDPMLDQPGQKTGRRVTAPCASGKDAAALMRGFPALTAGSVTRATLAGARYPAPETVTFGGVAYTVRAEPFEEGFRVLLEGGGPTVELVRFPSQDGGTWSVLWAGDLDRDGALDLLLMASRKYSVGETWLFLSSAATTAPIALAAMHRAVGD